ncbi:MAG: zinc-dependent peptidase [Chitinophagaceae bacterium]|nr:zinc-dependent peptidase [Chitinophagaceae bacterium]
MEIILILAIIGSIILLQDPISSWIVKLKNKQQFQKFLTQETYYHSIISPHMRFYNRLNTEDQQKFLFRTYLFRKSKKFHYIEVEESADMPILISAVAVQLTFGLDKFMLNYFKNIFVLKDDYHYGFYSRPFQGHVDHSGIYLSWDNFMKGIHGLTANCNVGIHEMGHALTYVNFITQTEEDKHFKKEFKNFSKVARPIFEAMQYNSRNVLGAYAATNYHEFWAVSVEVFFENPIRLRHEFPELYKAMKSLLRQDPLVVLNAQRIAA